MFADKPCIAMPVFSSGQTARQAPDTYRALGSVDLIFAAGGGVIAHTDGPAAGVRSLRDAWDAALSGTPLDLTSGNMPRSRGRWRQTGRADDCTPVTNAHIQCRITLANKHP